MRFSRTSAAALAVSIPFAYAQTSTSCNPLEKTCPEDVGLMADSFNTNFMSGSAGAKSWSNAAGTTLTYGSQGAEFSMAQEGQAPTIASDFYVLFARVEVKMKAAPGQGIVSSVVMESDDLDEIDWEWLGGNTAQVETNFFGKGNVSVYDRAVYYPVATPQDDFHTYTIDWTAERIEWIVDGVTVRTLAYDDPLTNGGTNYPQTPMKIKLGAWCGGCSGEPEGTVQWAGGATTFTSTPYVMYVESVNIINYNPASSYEYQGHSGSWQSIKVINDGQQAKPSGGASFTLSSTPASQTVAPTKSLKATHIHPTNAVVSKTITGGAYSDASATPLNRLKTYGNGNGTYHATAYHSAYTHQGLSTTYGGSGATGFAASTKAGVTASTSPAIALTGAGSVVAVTWTGLFGALLGSLLL